MNKVSIVIPVLNRWDMLIESYKEVIDDDRVDSIVIYDDGSDSAHKANYKTLESHPKIKLHTGISKSGVHRAKRAAVSNSTTDWCVLFDSDNIIEPAYLDTIFALEPWDEKMVYQPEFLAPHFDFRSMSGLIVDKKNVAEVVNRKNNKLDTWGNAQNFFVNKSTYLNVWEDGHDVNGQDSLYFFYLLMTKGYSMKLTQGLTYKHRIHEGSNYMSDPRASQKVEDLINKLKQLR